MKPIHELLSRIRWDPCVREPVMPVTAENESGVVDHAFNRVVMDVIGRRTHARRQANVGRWRT
ncbi:MAG: hypothetical protein H6935_04690 [Thiobacillus sp.]|nr:hypothetical protein [Verrucomicrobiae bacterium]MCP5277643.1 hypothetical protein [Thiobacillus sp.]